MNGNIALSMEIGSAYALQVCLLQIPCLVLFSAVHNRFITDKDIINHTFSTPSLPFSFSAPLLLSFLSPSPPSTGANNINSTHLPAMGHGHRNLVRLPAVVHVRRR